MKVYRFEKNTKNRLQTILDDKIFLSCPEKFNDLSDCTLQKIYTPDFDSNFYKKLVDCTNILYPNPEHNYFPLPDNVLNDLKRFLYFSNPDEQDIKTKQESGRRKSESVKRIQQYLRTMTGVCCFFKGTPNHPLMWAHYADSHTGFCIEYEATEEAPLVDVNYATEPESPTIVELLLCPHETIRRIITTKNMEWHYENEARIISFDRSHDMKSGLAIQIPPEMKPVRIIQGAKFDANKNKALLKRLRKKMGDFALYEKFVCEQKNTQP